MSALRRALTKAQLLAADNPTKAKIALGIGGGLAGLGLARGAESLDELTTGGGEMPEHVAMALRNAGHDPDEYESSGKMPFRGAVGGASLGAIAGILGGRKGSALHKWMAYGGLGGGALGSGLESYRKRGE